MKKPGNIHFTLLLLSYFVLFSFYLTSCNQKKEKTISTSYEGKTSTDTLPRQTNNGNPTSASPLSDKTPNEVTNTYTATSPKQCAPNFKLLATPPKNQKIFYVSGFNPSEFKCWEELEKYGLQLCGKNPCLIYYVDFVNVLITSTPPNYIDEDDLQKHGIGRFENNGAWWEMKGSKIWNRKDKGYSYYNTNHSGGG